MQDYLQVQYLIENTSKVTSFIPPVFKYFTVVEGPSQTTGFNMENGNLREYVSFSYLLKPKKEGSFAIPAATARINGRSYRSNAVDVTVVKGLAPASAEDPLITADELIIKPGESAEKKTRNNMFLRLEVDRRDVFVGEPVVASYKLYTRLRSESKVTRRPSFNGFSVFDMANPESMESTREQYQGKDFNVYLLRKVQLYPLQPGTLELESMEVTNDVRFIRAEALDAGYSPAGILRELAAGLNNSGAIRQETIALENPPVAIQVKPLPPVTDSGYSGGVGHFSVRTSVVASEVHAQDVVELEIQVAGKGNFPMITAPKVSWPEGIDVFDGSSRDQFNKFVSPLSGSKIFTIPFTVKQEGSIRIPPVVMHYFDTESRSYLTVSSAPLAMEVLPARQRTQDGRPQPRETPANGWKYILTVLGLLLVFGSIYILLRRSNQSAKPVAKTSVPVVDTPQPAIKEDPLEKIRQAFVNKDVNAFYRQLNVVIDQCMMNKYQVDGRGNWEHGLLQKGVDPVLVAEVKGLKHDAELAMYTPFVMEGKMIEDLARIERIVC